MTPVRGDVWLFDLGMAEKVRPALVISVAFGDTDRPLVTIVPHMTNLRGSQFEIPVSVPFLRAGAFGVLAVSTSQYLDGDLNQPFETACRSQRRDWHTRRRRGSPERATKQAKEPTTSSAVDGSGAPPGM